MTGYLIVLAVGLLLGLPAGWLAERHHLRGWINGVRAADTATHGEHRRTVLDDYAHRLGLRGDRS